MERLHAAERRLVRARAVRLVVNPADTWSNLAYLLGAFAMWRLARRTGRADLAHFAPASVAVGAFSFAYHASYTWLLQFFDFVGMFVFCFLVIARNAVRLGWIAPARERALLARGRARRERVRAAALPRGLPDPGDGVRADRRVDRAGARALAPRDARRSAAATRVIGARSLRSPPPAAFSLADVTRAWCDPDDHWLQGHALWHVLSAAALVLLQRFYASRAAAPA